MKRIPMRLRVSQGIPKLNPPSKLQWRKRLFSIQNKIILPYLTITVLVAIVGTYIVTRLVAGSLQERLSNQLVESSNVARESLIRQENQALSTLRLIALAGGMDQALIAEDSRLIQLIASAFTQNAEIENWVILDRTGNPLARQGAFPSNADSYRRSNIVSIALGGENLDSQSSLWYTTNPPLFVFATPIRQANQVEVVVGLAMIGIPALDVVRTIKQEALVDVILYDQQGQVTSTTYISELDLAIPALTVSTQLSLISRENRSETIELGLNNRAYQGIYVPLQLRNDTFGLMAVFLPSEFIVIEGGTSAQIFALLFTLASFMIILIGLVLSSTITTPVNQLVQVAQAVTGGDLGRRSSLKSADEIGFLSQTFNVMTARLEERTRQLEIEAARLNSILSTSQSGIIMVDSQGRLAFVNQAAWRFLHPKIEIEKLFNLAPNARIEANGYILAVQQTEVRDEEQMPIGTLIGLYDITLEEQARRLQDRFIAHVSHELRTPLTVIKGYSDLMMAALDIKREVPRSYVEGVGHQTMILDDMIIGLLSVSQMNAGTFSLRRTQIDLIAIIEETFKRELPRFEENNLQIQFKLPYTPVWLYGDAQRLSWALLHILDNAIQYTEANGKICCEVEILKDEVKLLIQDTGVGIQPAFLPHVFEPYYRRETFRRDGTVIDPRGMGLGLYLVKNIVELHGGKVELASIPNQGTCVILWLPINL